MKPSCCSARYWRWRRTTALRVSTTPPCSLRHRHQAALVELDRLCKAEPANRAYQTTFATACVGLGRFEQALAIYRQLLQSGPRMPSCNCRSVIA